jgi:hypothetical protein
VKKHIAGMDAESTPVARLFIPSGEHNGRISPCMGMPALKQPAVAPFVACRDRHEERPLRWVAQWKDSPSSRNVRRSTMFCHESTTPEMPFLYASLMHRNRPRRHRKPILLHQIGNGSLRSLSAFASDVKLVQDSDDSMAFTHRRIDMRTREAAPDGGWRGSCTSAIVTDRRLDRVHK